MNGARSIFMRKGYWLTALAALVLLAASSGTAQAQIQPDIEYDKDGFKVEGLGKTIDEGDATVIVVSLKAVVPAGGPETDVTVTVSIVDDEEHEDENPADTTDNVDDGDVTLTGGGTTNSVEVMLNFPANDDDAEDVTYTRSANVYLGTGQDGDAEDEDFAVMFVVEGLGTQGISQANMEVTIEDDEEQDYTLTKKTTKPMEGTPFEVTLEADPAHDDGSVMMTLHLDDPTYSVGDDEVTIDGGDEKMQTITITPPSGANGDGNRVEDSVTLTAHSGVVGRSTERADLTIKVADKNELPAVAMVVTDKDGVVLDPQPTSVAEGTSIMVAVMPLDEDEEDAAAFAEKLTVALTPTGTADSSDYTLVRTIEIPATMEMSDSVELEVRSDEDVGMESLMFDAVVSGDSKIGPETRTSAGVLSLYIDDATTAQITPKSSEADYDRIKAATADLNPGETVELMTSDLFTVMDGFNAGYSVSVEGDSVSAFASGEVVTINAEIAGESKITVTGTASMSTSSLIPSQTVSNVASLTFPVTVEDTTLSVTVSADPMEIAEGDTSTITATASREITVGDGAVEIDLTVVGDGELDADSITIAMGEMSGSAMLTATEDDADFEDETVTVVATGSGIDGTMQVAVAVTDNDEAPAVPNQISAKPQDEAYPVITAAIAAGAGEDEMLTPGESVELMASDLFTVMDGYTASYRVSVEGTAVSGSASGDSISVTAGAAGEAKVTITGTAKMAASSFDASQDATNVASITFPVTVEAEPEPVVPEPVPALPLIAQWLLGLGLMGGGARQLFRRRRQGS